MISRPTFTLLLIALVLLLGLASIHWAAQAVDEHDEGIRTATRQALQVEQLEQRVLADAKALREAQAALQRAQRQGRAAERERSALHTRFAALQKEIADAPLDPVDGCVLPAERLRVWTDANAGGGRPAAPGGATPAEPHAAAGHAAAAGLWPHARPGSEPPAGGSDVSRPGHSLLPPAAVPAAMARSGWLPTLAH